MLINAERLQAALALHRQGRLEQAEALYNEILQTQPQHFDALQLLAALAAQGKRSSRAVELFDQALKINPNHASALNNRGNALRDLNRLEQALDSYDKALTIQPDYAEALNNRGIVLRDLNHPEQALTCFERALAIQPDYAEAHNNCGNILLDLNRPEQALHHYVRAVEIRCDYAEAHRNEGMCRLLLGQFILGWQKYQWRWKTEPLINRVRNFKQPLWLGNEPLKNKTILLYSEQGLGDTLQFCRYARRVAMLGATVILEVQAPLKLLLKDLEGVTTILAKGETLPDFDYHCPLLSLPLAFKTDISTITNASYLKCDQQKIAEWESKLDQSSTARIGLVWCGMKGHKNDHNRSIAFDEFKALMDDQADYYCLQKELRHEDAAILQTNIKFYGDALIDFTDTAALLALMDLVITVDTSVAHLAGAMGKAVWILLPCNPDWRWLLDRNDSPWYQSAKLFRQPSMGDWKSVIVDVKAALNRLIVDMTQRKSPVVIASPQQNPPIQANSARLQIAFALYQQGQLDQAEILYKEILQSQPQHFDALQLLATIAVQRKNSALAVELLDQALKINPNHACALNNRGLALLELQRLKQALSSFDGAIAIQSDYAVAHFNRGVALFRLKRPVQALNSFEQALRINPDYAEALNNCGGVLLDLQRSEQALENFDKAITIKPDYAEAHFNRGSALRSLKRPEPALHSYNQALALKSDYPEAHNNRAATLLDLKRPQQALSSYERAIAIKPDYAEAHWNESLCRLLLGEFSLGWRKYEWRWKTDPPISTVRNFKQPLWLGKESLKNKTILLYCEQGLGDTIQFCRYVYQVAKLGAKVIFEVQSELKSLLKNLKGAATVLSHGENLPDFDFQCPLLSLPLAFKTDISTITNTDYLQCDQQKRAEWEVRLEKSDKKRVGLVWNGRKTHLNDYNRSIVFNQFKNFLNDQADYYCLQKELSAEDKVILEQSNIKFYGDALQDFSDTAALLGLMDLVVSVDTSVAHLAGAMGKRVWILLPYNPDWRWLLDRNDSPWYRSAKLFRQTRIGDWDNVIVNMKDGLDRFCS